MSSNSFAVQAPSGSSTRAGLLETMLETALLAGERHVQQFAQLAALARTIEACDVPAVDRAKLLSMLESVANDAEANAELDVKTFQGLLAGQLTKRSLQQASEAAMADVIVAPGSDTKH
ncbi:hypothetical protein [Paraburkholderia sp. GAS334]|uniref:hypothetical protein n=1 Tax=Paraburkholderia sp. GAS334 TaxID=3035131 RepID=UPI003D212040